MWRVLVVLLAACTFQEVPADAPIVRDAPSDAAPARACRVHTSGVATLAGVLGGSGGGTAQPDVVCGVGELPIGFAFDMSAGNVAQSEPAVVTLHVRCGTIERDAAGVVTSTPAELVTRTGLVGACFGSWGPTSTGAEMWCPGGQVIVGMLGNMPATSLYNTVAMRCSPFAGGASTTFAFPTGNFTNHPELVACPPGTAVASFGVMSGCGQDELLVRCAPVTCD